MHEEPFFGLLVFRGNRFISQVIFIENLAKPKQSRSPPSQSLHRTVARGARVGCVASGVYGVPRASVNHQRENARGVRGQKRTVLPFSPEVNLYNYVCATRTSHAPNRCTKPVKKG